jgi:hypothetical protein
MLWHETRTKRQEPRLKKKENREEIKDKNIFHGKEKI